MTTAQTVFAVALGAVALLVVWIGGYVVSSTLWADRWTRRREGRTEEPRPGR